jgi:hypothetical protein
MMMMIRLITLYYISNAQTPCMRKSLFGDTYIFEQLYSNVNNMVSPYKNQPDSDVSIWSTCSEGFLPVVGHQTV